MSESVSRQDLGAWLIKCNPKLWDVAEFVADGNDTITDWSLTDNYRSRMMSVDDPIILWISGTHPEFPRGIWGLGHVTGEAGDAATTYDHDVDEDGVGYWLDESARLAVRYRVPVAIPLLLTAPATDSDLRAADISDLEVQRFPQGSNPSWVSKSQLARIEPLLSPWPNPPGEQAEITISGNGAGFGDPVQNRLVEHAAMKTLTAKYLAAGWAVHDVSARKVGWDLTCTHPDGRIARLEVKGVSGSRATVLLTTNELRAAADQDGWTLAVVTRALTTADVAEFSAADAIAAAQPYVFRATLDDVDPTVNRR